MKKFINRADDVVTEALKDMEAAYPRAYYRLDTTRTMSCAPMPREEQGCGRFLAVAADMNPCTAGKGMLDAACPGAIFTSPTPDQMHAATMGVSGTEGALHIVKNYTGDVMNFELAAEMVRAEGIPVQSVLVNDDVAVQNSKWTAGRRGVGATVLMEKLCGAAAKTAGPQADRELCKRSTPRPAASEWRSPSASCLTLANRPSICRRMKSNLASEFMGKPAVNGKNCFPPIKLLSS